MFRGAHLNIYTKWGILSFMLDWHLKRSRDTCKWCLWIFHIEWFSHSE